MKKIKIKIRIQPYRWIIYGSTLAMLILIGILGIVLETGAKSLPDQTIALRWSEEDDFAQVSAFFSERNLITTENVRFFRHSIEEALKAENIESRNTSARLYVDDFYSTGEITIKNGKTVSNVKAFGVDGDFFLFHPVKLVSGSYFTGNDLMSDSVILDRETAWQLFGSDDIVGMQVTIGGIPHRIAGVYERPEDDISALAGIGEPTVFVSYNTLSLNSPDGAPVLMYEVCMPNPVKGFALNIFNGEEGFLNGYNSICIENSKRFSYNSYVGLLKTHSLRRMKTDSIVLPYWENLARVKEDRLMYVALVQWIAAGITGLFWFGYIVFRITRINVKKIMKREEESYL